MMPYTKSSSPIKTEGYFRNKLDVVGKPVGESLCQSMPHACTYAHTDGRTTQKHNASGHISVTGGDIKTLLTYIFSVPAIRHPYDQHTAC